MDDTLDLQKISLERMCFDLIVQKFEQFYFASTISNNVNLQQNIEFLQRRFSFQLLTALYEKRNLKEKYFELLINEHLHFLNGEWLENSRYINSTEDIFRRLPNLTRVSFRKCGDEILENIALFCPNIVEIDVCSSKVTDVGVMYLCEKNGMVPCPKLKTLLLQNSNVTDVGVEFLLRKLPLLEKIDYRNVDLLLYSINKKSLSKLQKVHSYNLVQLNVLEGENLHLENIFSYVLQNENIHASRMEYFRFYSEVLKTCLTVCPRLESIACFITDKEQLNLFNHSHLKKVALYVWNILPNINIDNFIKMNGRNLTSLTVNKCIISVSVLAENCPVLEVFEIANVNFTDEDDDVRVTFPCLIECYLSDIYASDAKAFCLLLSSSPKLKCVSFSSCQLSLDMKNKILMCCINSAVQKIKFRYMFLEVNFVRDILLSCRSLKIMGFVSCSFDVYDVEDLFDSYNEGLPIKPCVYFLNNRCTLGMSNFDPFSDLSRAYLSMNPEETYENSTVYDSPFREIDDNDEIETEMLMIPINRFLI